MKESVVTLGANKVEVKLKKASALSWKDLGSRVVDDAGGEETSSAPAEPEVVPEEPDVDLSDL